MKKILIIITALLVIILGAWIFFRDSETPIVETIIDGLPFGSGEDINIPGGVGGDMVGQTTPFDENISAEDKLFRISNTPVAGFVPFARGEDTIVRYMDRATGHIFDVTLPQGNSPLEKDRVTNTTLTKIYEAHFRADGSEVLIQSLNEAEEVTSVSLTLTPPRTTSTSTNALWTITSTNLRGEIDSATPGTSNSIFYVLKDAGAIVSSTWTGGSLRTLFQSEFNQWQLSRAGANLLVQTKASADAPGFAYLLNSNGGTLSKVVGPLNGLTAASNSNASRTLYSYAEGNSTKLFVQRSGGVTSEILPATIAEKCIWSTEETSVFYCGTPINGINSKEPDGWYQGRTHFSDYIWRFDTDSEIAQLVSDPKADFSIDLDVFKPTLAGEDKYLIFLNKNDLTLWAVKLF